MSKFVTVGEAARLLGVSDWKVRRAVDSLEGDVPRAGLYRLISTDRLAEVMAKIQPGMSDSIEEEAK